MSALSISKQGENYNKVTHIFSMKNNCYKIRLALKEFRSKKVECFLIAVSIILAVSVLVIIWNYEYVNKINTFDEKNDLKVEFVDDNGNYTPFDDDIINNYFGKLSCKANVTYDYYIGGTTVLKKEQLSDEMIEFFYNDLNYRAQLLSDSQIEVSAAIIGTDDIKDSKLYIYNKTAFSEFLSTKNKIKAGDLFKFNVVDRDTFINIKVDDVIDKLPNNTNIYGVEVVFVTSLENVINILPEYKPEIAYINYDKNLTEEDMEIIEALYSNPNIRISEPAKEKTESSETSEIIHKALIIAYILFVLILLFVLLMALLINTFVRIREYAILKQLGATDGEIVFIIAFRLYIIVLLSIVFEILITYISTKVIFEKIYGTQFIMFYKYNWNLLIKSNLVIILMLAILTIIMKFVLYKIDVSKVIREL